jgi:tetratricopeptide (TPR) repeat protein
LVFLNTLILLLLQAAPTSAPAQDMRVHVERCASLEPEDVALKSCLQAIDGGAVESGIALPASDRFYLRLGRALEQVGRFDDAVRAYRAGVRLFPERAELHFQIGALLFNVFDAYEEAMGPLSEAIRRGRDTSATHELLGLALLKMGRHDDAQVALREAARRAGQASRQSKMRGVRCWDDDPEIENRSNGKRPLTALPKELNEATLTRSVMLLKLCVTERGDVARVLVLESSGNVRVDAHFTNAMMVWRFMPAERDKKKIRSVVPVAITLHAQ